MSSQYWWWMWPIGHDQVARGMKGCVLRAPGAAQRQKLLSSLLVLQTIGFQEREWNLKIDVADEDTFGLTWILNRLMECSQVTLRLCLYWVQRGYGRASLSETRTQCMPVRAGRAASRRTFSVNTANIDYIYYQQCLDIHRKWSHVFSVSATQLTKISSSVALMSVHIQIYEPLLLKLDLHILRSPSIAATTAWRWETSSDFAGARVCSPSPANLYTQTHNALIRPQQHIMQCCYNHMTDGEDRYVPDDLPLLLRTTGPEPQDYVADLDREKYTKTVKIHHQQILHAKWGL